MGMLLRRHNNVVAIANKPLVQETVSEANTIVEPIKENVETTSTKTKRTYKKKSN